jgi:hypothetical protein
VTISRNATATTFSSRVKGPIARSALRAAARASGVARTPGGNTPRSPVSKRDPVKLRMDALWPRSSSSVCREPDADHVPSNVRVSPGAGALRGSTAGPEHAAAMSQISAAPGHGDAAARTALPAIAVLI